MYPHVTQFETVDLERRLRAATRRRKAEPSVREPRPVVRFRRPFGPRPVCADCA